ncbi:hypothetical protein [Streptomyces sp. NPDC045470]
MPAIALSRAAAVNNGARSSALSSPLRSIELCQAAREFLDEVARAAAA